MALLLLLRHADAARPDPFTADIDRALTEKGYQEAAAIGLGMAERNLAPDRIICSAARRTRETLAGILPALPGESAIHISPGLYGKQAGDYRRAIQEEGGTAPTLLVIGHNPIIQELAAALGASPDAEVNAAIAAGIPTAGLVAISFDIVEWSDLPAGDGQIVALLTPASIAEAAAGNGPA